jgi:hypothetical protein
MSDVRTTVSDGWKTSSRCHDWKIDCIAVKWPSGSTRQVKDTKNTNGPVLSFTEGFDSLVRFVKAN